MPKVNSQIQHPLSALNLPFYYLSLAVSGNSNEILELDGVPEEALLRQALQAAVARHPTLNSRIRQWGGWAFWRQVKAHEPIVLHWHDFTNADDNTLHKHLLGNIWDNSFNLQKERPVRFHLTVTARGSILQLITSHVWEDARAGYRLSYDICQAYSALFEGKEPNLQPINIYNRNSDRLLAKAMKGKQKLYRQAAWKNLIADISTKATGLQLPSTRGPNDFLKIDLGHDFLTRLRRAAKTRGVTVHSLITAALIMACRDHDRANGIHEARQHQVHDLFSLRAMAEENADDLYDTMVLPFETSFSTDSGAEEVVNQAMKKLQNLKDGEIFVDYFKVRLIVKLLSWLPKRVAIPWVIRYLLTGNVLCTNPGPITYDIDCLGDIPVRDFYSFSQMFPPGRIMLVFSTFRDCLRLIVVYDQAAFANGVESEFITPLLTHLQSLIDDTRITLVTPLVATGT